MGDNCYGAIVRAEFSDKIDIIVGDGRRAYAGLLRKIYRWIVFVKPRTLIVVDDVESEEPRKFEILLHPDGELKEEEQGFTIVNGEAALQILFLRSGPEEPRVCHRLSRSYYEARGALLHR